MPRFHSPFGGKTGRHLHGPREVNAFHDRLGERIHNSGEDRWFFTVNYSGRKTDPDAWFAFSRRGKDLNRDVNDLYDCLQDRIKASGHVGIS